MRKGKVYLFECRVPKERYTYLNTEFQRIAKRGKKPFSVMNAKK